MTFSNISNESNSKYIRQMQELQFAKFLLNQASDAAFWLDSEAQFLYVNDMACRLFGYSREELLCMTMQDIDPDFAVEVWSEQWRSLQQNSITVTSRYRTKAGQIFPLEISFIYVERDCGEFSCAFVREKVNVESKYREEALRQGEAKFRALIETTDAIVFVIQDKQLCYVNSAAETITGYTQEDLLVRFDLRQMLEIKQRQEIYKKGRLTLLQNQEVKIVTKDGKERWLACSVRAIDFQGKPADIITAIDITNRKHAELEISIALQQEKHLNQLRAHFIYMVTHEVRAPLNVISLSSDLLEHYNDQLTEDKRKSYLDSINIAIAQIDKTLEEVLVFTQAEVGKLIFEPKPLDLGLFCSEIVSQIQLMSNSQQAIAFVKRGDCSKACMDKQLLHYILTNILSNAIKYSYADSTIELELSCQDGEAIFKIKDKGIGIPAADLKLLFEPFHRGKNVGNVTGSGLGLAIVKKLVDLHGGHISVVSEVGFGTTFTLTLPYQIQTR